MELIIKTIIEIIEITNIIIITEIIILKIVNSNKDSLTITTIKVWEDKINTNLIKEEGTTTLSKIFRKVNQLRNSILKM